MTASQSETNSPTEPRSGGASGSLNQCTRTGQPSLSSTAASMTYIRSESTIRSHLGDHPASPGRGSPGSRARASISPTSTHYATACCSPSGETGSDIAWSLNSGAAAAFQGPSTSSVRMTIHRRTPRRAIGSSRCRLRHDDRAGRGATLGACEGEGAGAEGRAGTRVRRRRGARGRIAAAGARAGPQRPRRGSCRRRPSRRRRRSWRSPGSSRCAT